MAENYVLDAWALLALLQTEQPAASRVKTLLQQAQMASNVQVYLSIINLGEIAYILERNYGAEEANQTIADIRQLPITIVQASENRVMAAARLKANYRMSYADAFAAAAAEEWQAILITGDPELISLQGIIQVEALERGKKA